MKETNIYKLIQLRVSELRLSTLWRNNTGTGWQGETAHIGTKLVISNPRPLQAGLCKGSSDLIGFTPVTITADMVGKSVAVFTGIEVKTKRGRATAEQINFLEAIRQAGGIGLLVHSEEEAITGIQGYSSGISLSKNKNDKQSNYGLRL